MKLSGRTQVVGVIGHPVGHSRSPEMHNAAFEALGLDWVYVAFEVAPEALPEALKGASALGIRGLNVTVPHKPAALALADEASEEARLVGAANTLVFKPDGIYADTTDGYGFRKSLEAAGVDPKGWRVVILGAGGVARSLLVTLLQLEAASVVLVNRTYERAVELAERARSLQAATAVSAVQLGTPGADEALAQSELVVNATSYGMSPRHEVPLLFPADLLESTQVVFDTIYTPLETELLKAARRKGCFVINGVDMLVWQGARSFELWTGQAPPVEVMKKALLQSLQKG